MNRRLLALAALLLGCRASAPVAPDAPEAPLTVTPARLALSVIRGRGPAHASIAVRAERALELREAVLGGEGAALFRVLGSGWPARLRADEELPLGLALAAKASVVPGVHRARLTLRLDGGRARAVELVALVVEDAGPEREPPLQDVVTALALGARIGSSAFALGMAPAPLGEEVGGGWFRRAGPGPVSLTAVASFTSPAQHAFGYSAGQPAVARTLGTLDWNQNQHLHPTFDGGTQTVRFDPGAERFTLWVDRAGLRYHAADALNPGGAHHARVYPVRDGAGAVLPGQWLVALEESDDGDYQDVVLLLSNAVPEGLSGPAAR